MDTRGFSVAHRWLFVNCRHKYCSSQLRHFMRAAAPLQYIETCFFYGPNRWTHLKREVSSVEDPC